MSTPTARRALVRILETERRLTELTLATYRQWLPSVEQAVLPALAASLAIPPDPAAINLTQPQWEAALDGVFLPGVEGILTWQLTAHLPDPEDDEDEEEGERRRSDPLLDTWRAGYVADVRNRMVNTPDSVYRDIVSLVERGTREGASIPELRDQVAHQLSVSNTTMWRGRAETVARTEAAGLQSAATVEAARFEQRATGDTNPLVKVWTATIDGRTRRAHAAADGQRVALDGKFKVGKSELRFPGDPRGAPEDTIRCRCAVTVLDAEDALPSEDDRQTERGEGDATVRNRRGSRQDQIEQWAEDGIVRARDDPDGIGTASAQPEENPMAALRTFTALLMPLGVPGRSQMFQVSESFTLLDTRLPLALKWQKTDDPGHDGGFTVGAIEQLEVRDNGLWGTGVLLNTPEADEAAAQITEKVTQPSTELVVRSAVAVTPDGTVVTEEQAEELFMAGEPILMRWDEGELVGTTLVSVPEFRETSIELTGEVDRDIAPVAEALAASAAPILDSYPAAAFEIPEADEPTPIHVTPDGRVIGHLACWDTCHSAVKDRCVRPYRSQSGYAEFHQSHVLLDSGEHLRVGRLTVGGGHGPVGNGMGPALEHYDNVATCWALVRATDGEHGIWVSGIVNPAADTTMVRQACTAPHSGHWERVAGAPELIAAHAVNTPGYPIITRKQDRQGDLALVASMAPRGARAPLDTTILRDVAKQALDEYRREEGRRKAAAELRSVASKRRRAQALALLGRKDG